MLSKPKSVQSSRWDETIFPHNPRHFVPGYYRAVPPGQIHSTAEALPELTFMDCSSNPLPRRHDLDLLGPHDRRRIPFAGQCVGLRSIEAQAKVEGPFGRRKPVGLLFCTWALVLKI
jgi:hypothetical protein